MIGIVSKAGVYVLGAALLASLAFGGAQCSGKQRALVRAADAEAKLSANIADYAVAREQFQKAARDQERRHQSEMNKVAAHYAQQRKDDVDAEKRLVADLRAGNQRLRQQWRGCQAAAGVPEAGGSVGGADGEDRLREASAGRIVGAVRACQSQRDALLNIVEGDRKQEQIR